MYFSYELASRCRGEDVDMLLDRALFIMNLANILMLLVRQHAVLVTFSLMKDTPPQLAPVS